jgi:hypothetical protein
VKKRSPCTSTGTRRRHPRMLTTGLFIAGLATMAPSMAAAIPGHPDVARIGYCEASARVICRIDVPNGDFSGGPDDTYSHAGFFPAFGTTHRVADHIAPWRYVDGSGFGYADETATAEPFTLRMPGDGVEQTITLPAVDAAPGITLAYTIHAHVGSFTGQSGTRIDATLMEKGEAIASANVRIEQRDTRGAAVSELVAHVTVPEGHHPDALSIRFTSEPGHGRVPLTDVFVVRAPEDAYIAAMRPTW